LESAYDKCLSKEFDIIQLIYKNQVELPIVYKGIKVDAGYRIDKIIEDKVIIKLKAVEHLLSVHKAQLLTYMKLTGIRVGLLINFSVSVLKDGIKRMVL